MPNARHSQGHPSSPPGPSLSPHSHGEKRVCDATQKVWHPETVGGYTVIANCFQVTHFKQFRGSYSCVTGLQHTGILAAAASNLLSPPVWGPQKCGIQCDDIGHHWLKAIPACMKQNSFMTPYITNPTETNGKPRFQVE